MDVDLDGFEDLLISNGFERDANNTDIVRELERIKASSKLSTFAPVKIARTFPRLSTANLAFRNNQEARFEEDGRVGFWPIRSVSRHGLSGS